MTTTDWIALVQAVFLAAAAFWAWRTYGLATREHQEARDAAREARDEARKAPLRELLNDLVREFKRLAAQAEQRVPVAGIQLLDLVKAQQRRLEVALTFMPPDVFNLFATRELTTCKPQDVTRAQIDKARGELLTLFARIDDGEFSIRQVAPRSLGAERAAKGDI